MLACLGFSSKSEFSSAVCLVPGIGLISACISFSKAFSSITCVMNIGHLLGRKRISLSLLDYSTCSLPSFSPFFPFFLSFFPPSFSPFPPLLSLLHKCRIHWEKHCTNFIIVLSILQAWLTLTWNKNAHQIWQGHVSVRLKMDFTPNWQWALIHTYTHTYNWPWSWQENICCTIPYHT